jgi:hypothetical protein
MAGIIFGCCSYIKHLYVGALIAFSNSLREGGLFDLGLAGKY